MIKLKEKEIFFYKSDNKILMKRINVTRIVVLSILFGIFGNVFFVVDKSAIAKPIVANEAGGEEIKIQLKTPAVNKKSVKKKAANKVKIKQDVAFDAAR